MKRNLMRILWLKSDFLYPADTGGKIRSYNLLKQLAKNHEVNYLCLSDEAPSASAVQHLESICRKIEYIPFKAEKKFSLPFYTSLFRNLFSSRPYVINKYQDIRITEKIHEYINGNQIDIILCDFLEMSVNVMGIKNFPMVLFQHNVETEIWRRHFEINENPLKKGYLYLDYQKYFKYEKDACAHFDDVLVVSDSDGRLLREQYGVRHTTSIPTGVDIEFFQPKPQLREDGNIIFVGSMDWLPNQDAVDYFVEEVYPQIKSKKPDVRFTIVGRRPSEAIQNLAKRDSSITVTGTVDDIRSYVDYASVYVVPIRIGGGTRIKIYEAMAQKKAIVSTTVGAEGLPLTAGKHILIEDDPGKFANAVCRVMDDKVLMENLSENAYKLVTQKYSWEKIASVFADALESVLNNRRCQRAVGENVGESQS